MCMEHMATKMLLSLFIVLNAAIAANASTETITESDFRLNNITVIGAWKGYHRGNSTHAMPLQMRFEYPRVYRLLQKRSVRAFDLDFYWDEGRMTVANILGFDANTSCKDISTCVTMMSVWSSVHRMHEPLYLLVHHVKNEVSQRKLTSAQWATVWDAIVNSWDYEMITTQTIMAGSKWASVLETVHYNQTAWPTLESARGKLVVAFAREPASAAPNDDESRIGAFAMEIVVSPFTTMNRVLGVSTKWSAFYMFSGGTAKKSAIGADLSTWNAVTASDLANSGFIVVTTIDEGYYHGGVTKTVSDSLSAAARSCDVNSDGIVTIEEIVSFMTACDRTMSRQSLERELDSLGKKTHRIGYTLETVEALFEIELPQFAVASASFETVRTVALSAAKNGAHILLTKYPGSYAAYGGAGYSVSFTNDAAVACNGLMDKTCTLSSAVDMLTLPQKDDLSAK